MGHTKLREASFDISPLDNHRLTDLIPPLTVKIPGLPEYMHSFTSLSGSSLKGQSVISAPGNFDFGEKTLHTLPAGKNTGTLLHAILETVPFNIVDQGLQSLALQTHVSKYTLNTPFAKWQPIICDIIYNTLTAKLPLGEDSFSMSEVQADLCYKEHEFVYTTDLEEQKNVAHTSYVKGIIDLIFQHKGKYFIVDWKSNWLGQQTDDYISENLARAMHEHHYYLQAELYKRALKRYLHLCDPRPFEEVFGGVYYLFLRGLSSNSKNGIVLV
ncbi:MAG: PD-(D/E)XK nuclease family protein [Parachlamydiaceae bacterium]|nr:PD-(D/E)XK nuclease family protein [Parachlamydiaceae bacterium]